MTRVLRLRSNWQLAGPAEASQSQQFGLRPQVAVTAVLPTLAGGQRSPENSLGFP